LICRQVKFELGRTISDYNSSHINTAEGMFYYNNNTHNTIFWRYIDIYFERSDVY